MSQEYTEDKEVTLTKLSSGRRLFEALLILVAIFAVYLMVALVSFNPSDPSWSQTAWHEPIHNLAGGVGAWLADTLFFIFGVLAYAVPPIILVLCWTAFRQRGEQNHTDYFALSLRLIGTLALILTSCGLAALNIDDLYYFASGGVLGSLLASAIVPWFNGVGATLTLLCIWAVGVTLFTGWSWLTIAEKLGGVVLGSLAFLSNRSRREPEAEDATDIEEYSEPLVPEPEVAKRVVTTDEPLDVSEQEQDDVLFTAPSLNALPGTSEYPEYAVAQDAVNFAVTEPDSLVQQYDEAGLKPSPLDAETEHYTAESHTAEPYSTEPYAGEPVGITSSLSTPQAPVEEAIENPPPLYRFELPSAPPAPAAPTSHYDDDEPRMGNWQALNEPAAPQLVQQDTPPVSMPAAPVAAFVPVFSASGDENLQTKQGIGPELPRPNPVRIPTRRELASFGIKLPSQRRTEQEAANSDEPQLEVDPYDGMTAEQQEETQIAALRQAYAEQQQARYDEPPEDDEAMLEQEEALRQAFAEQQQARYDAERIASDADNAAFSAVPTVRSSEPDSSEPGRVMPLNTALPFSFSPMADLVDDGPSEPLFTLSPQPESESPASATPKTTAHEWQPSVLSAAQPPAWQPEVPSAPSSWQPPVAPTERTPWQAPEPVAPPSVSAPVAVPVPQQAPEPAADMDSLIHPFLMRNERPLQKPTTPLPTLDLLASPPEEEEPVDMFALEQTARLVEARLGDYRVKAEVVGISPGPVITRYELDLAPGVKAARISNLARDLARSLSTIAVRVVDAIPGKPYVGLELPNKHRQTVYLREVLDCAKFRESTSPLAIVLGKDIAGQPVVADLAKMPHLLVAGTTGSGKSVGVNAMIISMLYKATPEDVRFIMIDPKMLELSVYEGIPHLLTEVVTDMKDAANALRWCVNEMERRYKLMSALGVRNLAGYNERVLQAEAMGRPVPDPFWKPSDSMDITPPVLEKLPYIVVMVDEFADLMMAVGKKVEELIARLAQKARAAGIHLVLATQRPSVDVITGLIKANIPTRIAFTVSSKIDSRTILDQGGAESLLGMGDMLYMAPNSTNPIRVHGAFVRDQEVHAVVQDWKARGRPQYIDSILSTSEEGEGGSLGLDSDEELDPLFDQAVAFVVDKRRASISGVQRQFRIGYNRAARIIEQMEAQGIVSPQGHNGNREVLAPPPHE